jgi:hypothetical protein
LVCVQPFPDTRKSILLLFNPILKNVKSDHNCQPVIMTFFVKAHALLFTKGSISAFLKYAEKFTSSVEDHISHVVTR